MNPKNFDELTKELAKSTSRRHALKTILTASVGGVVGLGVIRSVFGSNAFCDRWCHAVFGESRAAGKCTSDAAHHTGLCVTCGDVAPADICCARNSDGFCVGGTVVATCACSDPGTCGSYQFGCDGDPTCACATNSEGGGTCVGDATCSNATLCTTSADCPANSVCIVGSCCGTPVCLPLCGTEGAAAHRAPTGTGP